MTDSKRICVGAIAGAFGVKGEIRLKSFTSTPEDIETYGSLFSEDGTQSFNVSLIGQIKNGFTARLSGVQTKEQADALRGVRLFVDREMLPGLSDDEFYHADLIGLEVYDTGGSLLGRVENVLNHGASDLLEINPVQPGETILLPFTLAVVPNVDLNTGRLIADPPEGLF